MSSTTPRDLHDFMRAVRQAFPDRSGLKPAGADTNLTEAWLDCASALGMTPVELAQAVASHLGVEAAGPLGHQFNVEVLQALPVAFCQKHRVFALEASSHHMVIASSTPTDEEMLERARFLCGKPVKVRLAPPQELEDALLVVFGLLAERESAQSDAQKAQLAPENSVVTMGQALLRRAVDMRASDLHIQSFLGTFVARIRVDGRLQRLVMLPAATALTLIRHFKVRSGMDPTINTVPQDGRMTQVIAERDFDMRVSSLPASRGERLVIRFLDQGRVHRLGAAGFSLAALQSLRRAIARPSGMVLMTGPTGCGKTSTLYGMLAELNQPDVNIITVENPVEYRLPGASQVEVNVKAGLEFATALRSILRQDPDIVLIGEIRDEETANIAAQAALTGHLVLSTLHTNDATTAIPRLLNLGVDRTVLADSLAAIVAQRLCRKLCEQCKQPVADPLSPVENRYLQLTHNRPLYRSVGCKACNYSGFKGRLPIVDIIEMNAGLRQAVASGETRLDVLESLRRGGLKSLAASGSHRIMSGESTVGEVLEAVGPSFWRELALHHGTELSDDDSDGAHEPLEAGHAVLLISEHPDEAASGMADAVKEAGLRLHTCANAKAAEQLLHDDERIAVIVGDLPDAASLPQAAALLQEFRAHVAWSRLPALVLLPEALAGQQQHLRESGSMAEFLTKPVKDEDLMRAIQRAHAR